MHPRRVGGRGGSLKIRRPPQVGTSVYGMDVAVVCPAYPPGRLFRSPPLPPTHSRPPLLRSDFLVKFGQKFVSNFRCLSKRFPRALFETSWRASCAQEASKVAREECPRQLEVDSRRLLETKKEVPPARFSLPATFREQFFNDCSSISTASLLGGRFGRARACRIQAPSFARADRGAAPRFPEGPPSVAVGPPTSSSCP